MCATTDCPRLFLPYFLPHATPYTPPFTYSVTPNFFIMVDPRFFRNEFAPSLPIFPPRLLPSFFFFRDLLVLLPLVLLLLVLVLTGYSEKEPGQEQGCRGGGNGGG